MNEVTASVDTSRPRRFGPRLLIIDNYDSFTHNLAQLVHGLVERVEVVRNDAIALDDVYRLKPTHIVLSPGPGHPERKRDFGVGADIVATAREGQLNQPLLGVCLGHQGIAYGFGAQVVRGPTVMHGKTSAIHHEGRGLFRGLPSPIQAMRYHSLVVASEGLPSCLKPVATSEDGALQAFQHETRPIFGLQFHPESFGTTAGRALMDNFFSEEILT